MTDQPETLTLADAIVLLYRNTKLMDGSKELGTADRMIVEHHLGNSEDVVILSVDGKLKVQRVAQQMKVQMPSSPALESTVTFGNSLGDVAPDAEKRLLAIYKMFASL